MRHSVLNMLTLFFFCVYLYFFNRLLFMPALAEFSYYGLLIVPFMLLMFWLIHREQRKQAVVYTFMFFLLDQSVENAMRKLDTLPLLLSLLFIGLFLFPLSKWYARIRFSAFLAAWMTALGMNLIFPDNIVQALPYFYKKWSSEQVYIGEMTVGFPIAAKDIDGDGKDEIITLGNAEEVLAERKTAGKKPPGYLMVTEQLELYVWKWTDGQMVRVPSGQLNRDSILAALPKEYPGFPYYTLNERLQLVPLVQRQSLTEGMLQFGTAPYRALLLNLENIEQELDKTGGAYDVAAQAGTSFKQVELKNGFLSGEYQGTRFRYPSPATRIVGALRLGNGQEGLLVLGMDLQLLQMVDNKLTVTHELTREMQKGLAQSEFAIVDLNGNGRDELVIKRPYSTILAPQADGSWKILWSTEEKSFRFEDYDHNSREFAGLSKSAMRAKDTGYLTGFQYTDQGLKQTWKIFLTMNDAVYADLDGNGENELITTIQGTDKVYVWEKHGIPVTPILIGLTGLLFISLLGRRILHARKPS